MNTLKPNINAFQKLPDYVQAMLQWRRAVDPGFSVRQLTKTMEHCSPTLVTHVANGKRSITERSLPNFAALLQLDDVELALMSKWVNSRPPGSSARVPRRKRRTRAAARSTRANRDWLEVYVRSALAALTGTSSLESVFAALGGIAPINRVHAAIIKTKSLAIELDEQDQASIKLPMLTNGSKRDALSFYRQALDIAKQGLRATSRAQSFICVDLFLDRDANAGRESIAKSMQDLTSHLANLNLKANDDQLPPRLYQLVISLIPVGGSYSSSKQPESP